MSSSDEDDDDAPKDFGRFGRRNHVEFRLDDNRFIPAVMEIDDLGWFNSRRELYDDVERTVASKIPLDEEAKKPVEGIAYGDCVWIKYRVVHQPQEPFTLLVPTQEEEEERYSRLSYCGFRLEARVRPYM